MPLPEELLMARALDALDPGDAEAADAAMEPIDRLRMAALAHLAGTRATEVIALPAVRAALRRVAILGTAEDRAGDADPSRIGPELWRTGERISLEVHVPWPADTVRVVLFREAAGERRMLHPVSSWPALEVFRTRNGGRIIDLVLDGPPGLHRYHMVVVPADAFPVPWHAGDPAWDDLFETYLEGRLPGTMIEVEVSEAA